MCIPPPPPSAGDGGGGEPPTKFSKSGGLTGPQLLEGPCWERGEGGWLFFMEVAIFTQKNKIKIWNT